MTRSRTAARSGRPVALAIACVVVVVWVEFGLSIVAPAIANGHYPTSTYWVAPRLIWEGRSDALYDTEAFALAAAEFGARSDRGFIPNAPPAVLPLLPFGLLDERPAFIAWTLLSLAALVAAVALLLSRVRVSLPLALAVVAALPLFQPVRVNFSFGQAFTFLLLALTVATLPHTGVVRNGLRGGLGLGVAFVIKAWYGAAATVAAALGGRLRTAAVALAVIAGAVLISVPIVGVDGWRVWIETSLTWRQRPETSVTAYQTLHSLFSHLFRFDATWNPAPVVHAPLLAEVLWFGSVACIGLVTLVWLRRLARSWRDTGRLEPAMLPIALTVPVAILASPIAEDYHYVLTLLSFLVGGWIALKAPRSTRSVLSLLLVSLLLIGLPLPFNERLVEGWSALLFYPRVYGAIALWLSLVLVARSTGTDRGR